MSQPAVSVIIPTYNHAHYLGGALESVIAQTFANWEAIVVDDGSQDDPAAVVARYAEPRVRLIRQHNQGLSAARNTGIEHASGELLAFLDADDEWSPTFLQTSVAALAKLPPTSAGTYTRNYFLSHDGNRLPMVGGHVVPPEQFWERLLQGGFFPVHAAVVRADVVRAVGRFDTSLTSLEDWDLWLRVAQVGPLHPIPEPFAGYRTLPNSMSTNIERMHRNRLRVLQNRLGSPDSSDATRRAYGYAERITAFGQMDNGAFDLGWTHLEKAVAHHPDLLTATDTYYEIALSGQRRGSRGSIDSAALRERADMILAELRRRFPNGYADVPLAHALAAAHIALAMLAEHSDSWPLARHFLGGAIRHRPMLLTDKSIVRRGLKLLVGRAVVGRMRTLSTP